MTNTFWLVISAVFGLILGSFFNVVALRDHNRKSIVAGRSECPHCTHVLAWYDLIPLISFLSTTGRCRYCQKRISLRYPLVELVAAGLVALATWYGWVERGSLVLTVSLAISFLLFLSSSLIDLESFELPIDYVAAAGVIGGVGMVLSNQLSWLELVQGVVVGGGSIAVVLYGWLLVFKRKGMGEGDIVIAAAMGAIVGYPQILVALMAAVILGAGIGSLMLSVQKKGSGGMIPFGPFLSLGLLVSLVWGQALLQWYILYP